MMHMLFIVVKRNSEPHSPASGVMKKAIRTRTQCSCTRPANILGSMLYAGNCLSNYPISLCLQQVNEVNVDSLSLQLDLYFRISAGPSLVAQLLQRPASSAHMCRNALKTKQNLQKQLQ